MARSINQVILMGRLTRDPEQRTTTSGRTVVSFSIAVDRQTQDDQADFFDVTAWEKLGELARIGTRTPSPRQLGRQGNWQATFTN